ncbi:MAG: NAD-dependent epimerase/dehydratase family protein, partial [Candidatus Dadabacteria bacterium]
GVRHFFYQSALGASPDSSSRYQKTKALAEEAVRQSGIPFTIFRPSLVIGDGDGFTERLRELIGLGPVVTVPGTGNGRFQPLFVEDWVRCFLGIVNNEAALGRVYELGGPEHLTYNEILTTLMEALNISKPVVHVPMPLMKAGLPFMGIAQGLGRLVGKRVPSVSSEQLALLEIDNITELEAVEKSFGFSPIPYREALRSFIRPLAR